MVLEEGKENSAFSKFRSVAHGGLGLSLNCSPDVEIEALQDHENFLCGFRVHLEIKERAFWARAVGFYNGQDDAHHVGGPDLGVIVALESSMRRCPIKAMALSLMMFCRALQGEFVVATNKGIFAVRCLARASIDIFIVMTASQFIRNGFMPHIMGYKFIEYLCP
jgi:hypothetical protein